ncbi:MAG TPA: helix-turn-helix transcriptional regulator [Vicinamibacterales bacterium]|nr:helix-turn-helix transcriptional regulator [Vicinamibacterales bacterium]
MSPDRSADAGPLSTVAVEVLLALATGPKHGYAIKREIEDRIGDDFVLGSGSLYQALQRLERRGLIAERRAAAPGDARRGRVYALEAEGRRVLAAELGRMQRVLGHAKRRRLAIGPERT